MSDVRDTIHNHHVELAERLAAHVDTLETGHADQADLGSLLAFLQDDLLMHAQGEEAYLYPVVDPLVKQYGSATATMRVDHEFISKYVGGLKEIANAWSAATPEQQSALRKRAARLALQLQALLEVHLEKEERVYLPLFERYISAAEQERILDGMHEGSEEGPEEGPGHAGDGQKTVADELLDVRPMPPAQRHARIFALFDALPTGASFVLVNDHDPKPLRYQLLAERPGQLEWEYLEAGPEVWRVRLTKANANVAAGAQA